MKNIVICKTPLRISLFGGGTDFKNHFIKNPSSVISFTINQYIYIVLKKHNNKLFNEKYRLNLKKLTILYMFQQYQMCLVEQV